MQFRVGTGFDVHALVENRSLILAGVQIPYEKGLLGHSDADVALHALMDALLGAAGMGDIGSISPIPMPDLKAPTAAVFCVLLWNCCKKRAGRLIMWT